MKYNQAPEFLDEAWFDVEDEEEQKNRYLVFLLGENYGIDITQVMEIVGLQKITEVPEVPEYVIGVINLRGQVVPLIDVRTRFRMEPRTYDDRTCVIVVNLADASVGLIVDTVKEVLEIDEADISPSPKVAAGTSNQYIAALGKVGEDVVILLDVAKIIFEDDLEKIQNIETTG